MGAPSAVPAFPVSRLASCVSCFPTAGLPPAPRAAARLRAPVFTSVLTTRINVAVCLAVLALGAGGCWKKMRTVRGEIRVVQPDGKRVVLDRVEIAAYPKGLVKVTFAQATPKLAQHYSTLRTRIEKASTEEAEAGSDEGLGDAEKRVFAEMRGLLEMADGMQGDRPALEAIERRLIDLKDQAKTAGAGEVVRRFERLAALHRRNHRDRKMLGAAAPEIAPLLLRELPVSAYRTVAYSDGHYSLRVPTDQPQVLSAVGRISGREEDLVFTWIVPIKLALGTDVVVDLDNSNLFTDAGHSAALAEGGREGERAQ